MPKICKIESNIMLSSTELASFPVRKRSFDWREHGAVTPVKMQHGCMSSYAFAAVEAIESQFFIQSQRLWSLSEQQVVDCSKRFGNQGCQRGFIDKTFRYILTRGFMLEIDYPFVDQEKEQCKFRRKGSL